ncbi:hypothetical protein ACLK98_001773 [Acinetobacter baumannii]|nr:hypothetical protein [Acinetobacter baumannii]EKU0165888.1 hypothetical protein [Acinetobacter baumannii]EKU0421735.1 hypothetical protein [Acinetobacter baumannii]EKV0631349.1 hypothetical protein [Acinetobacter baumannii]EKV2825290.1 hypothetical protein [Acinetobacter baumannii]
MNAHPEIIEVSRLKSLIKDSVQALLPLSSEEDTVVTDGGNWIHLRYVGRGTEQIQLDIGDQFSIKTKISYLRDTLNRLAEIKKELRGG